MGTIPPARLRRLASLTAAVRATGYAGTLDYDPAGPTVRCSPPDHAAQEVIDGWDWSEATDPAEVVKAMAGQAVADLAAYKALANPTAAQRNAWEDRVCDVLTVIARRLLADGRRRRVAPARPAVAY